MTLTENSFKLLNSRVLLFTRTGFRYSGRVIDESNNFLIIINDRNGHEMVFNKSELAMLERIKDGVK